MSNCKCCSGIPTAAVGVFVSPVLCVSDGILILLGALKRMLEWWNFIKVSVLIKNGFNLNIITYIWKRNTLSRSTIFEHQTWFYDGLHSIPISQFTVPSRGSDEFHSWKMDICECQINIFSARKKKQAVAKTQIQIIFHQCLHLFYDQYSITPCVDYEQ